MDIFIEDLINTVNSLNEATVIVFFGDHQPNLNLSSDDLLNKNFI